MAKKEMKVRPTFKGKPMFPSEWLVAEDLEGREFTWTISRVTIERRATDTGPQPMPTLYFEELDRKKSDKRLGLNKTNARSVAAIAGTVEATKWPGTRITVYPTTTDAFGEKNVPCIRIRKPKPRQERKPPEPEPTPTAPPDTSEAAAPEAPAEGHASDPSPEEQSRIQAALDAELGRSE